jgi:hypothetical protein
MSDVIYMPENTFIMFSAIFLILIYYSFTIIDRTYYTDILTSLFSIILGVLLGYNSVIGIGISNYNGYDNFRSVPIALLFIAISIYIIIVLIAKIVDILRHTTDLEEMENEQ